jgi:TetR/AcrR family transcriptional regulator
VKPEKKTNESSDASSVERILAAAEALFAEQGFNAASMSAIAEQAGVSKANIFHHFNSKQALYQAVVNNACKEARARIDALEQSRGCFVERLTQYASAHLLGILEHSKLTRLILRDLLENGPEMSKELAEQSFGPNFSKLVSIIRNGQSQGELRSDIDPAMVAVMLTAANVYFFEARDILRHFPDVDFADDPQRYSTKVLSLLLGGILPDLRKPK